MDVESTHYRLYERSDSLFKINRGDQMDDRMEIFNNIKNLMKTYHPPLTPKVEDESHYDLWSVKDVLIKGRKHKEIYFAGLILQKSYVGFYYMPIYACEELMSALSPELIRLLKGKTCFHIKKLDDSLSGQINLALEIGYKKYQANGWI